MKIAICSSSLQKATNLIKKNLQGLKELHPCSITNAKKAAVKPSD